MFYRLLFNFREKELRLVRVIFAIYIFGFSYGTKNHVADIMEEGLLGYQSVPFPINLYWTLLTIFDPLAILFLLFFPRIGMILSVLIMGSDIAINSSVTLYYYLESGSVSLNRLPLQIAFGIFVFITTPIAWRRIRTLEMNRLSGGERRRKMLKEIQGYLTTLSELQTQVKNLLEGLPQEALDWRPIQGEGELATNSLAVITAHLAGSETYWMKEIIGRQPIQRDREAEFVTKGMTVSQLKDKLDTATKSAEEVLSSLNESQLEEGRRSRDRPVTVRWAILHVIEHMAQHLGHMQLTRQLWMARSRK